MARIYKKYKKNSQGRRYFAGFSADFQQQGRRRRVSLGTRDERVAQAKLVELERKAALGIWDPFEDAIEQTGVSSREAVRRFLKNRERHCSPSTVKTYGYVLNSFLRSLPPGLGIRSVSVQHVEDFLTLPQYVGALAEATRSSYADRFRIFFAWCKEEGITPHNPVPKKERRGKAARARKEEPPQFFTEEEFAVLLDVIKTDAQAKRLRHGNRWLINVIRFAVGTGLRRGEVAYLRWNTVNPFVSEDHGLLDVRNWKDSQTGESFTTKSGRKRTVPLVGDALQVVRQLHAAVGPDPSKSGGGYVFRGARGGKLGEDYVTKRLREYRRLARLPEALHFHSLRHTFASWFVQRKGDLYHLKEILGHADMEMTLKYAHLRPDALRSEMLLTFGAGLRGTSQGTPIIYQKGELSKGVPGTATNVV